MCHPPTEPLHFANINLEFDQFRLEVQMHGQNVFFRLGPIDPHLKLVGRIATFADHKFDIFDTILSALDARFQ